MMYELMLMYKDNYMKKEQSTLPRLMQALSIYMEDDSWLYAEIMNCNTGELLATWVNNEDYGVTTAG